MSFEILRGGIRTMVDTFADMCRQKDYFDYKTIRDLLFSDEEEQRRQVLELCQAQQEATWYPFWDNANKDAAEYLMKLNLADQERAMERGDDCFGIAELNHCLMRLSNGLEAAIENSDGLGNLSKSMQSVVTQLKEKGIVNEEMKLTAKQLKEIVFFLALYFPTSHSDIDKEAQELQTFLTQEEVTPDVYHEPSIPEIQNPPEPSTKTMELNASITLPFFSGTKDPGNLEIDLCCMENKSDKPICVTLKGSSLRRHLVASEKIWALKMHEKIVAFLPRMAVASKCIHIQTASGIQIRYLNRVEQLPQQASVLAIGEGGRLFVDEKGSISNEYSTGVFQNIMIGEKRAVCWGRCCIRSYGLLFSDGSFFGSQAYPNWDRLLGFDITSRQRIAILSDRTAVDKDGKILGRNVAAVSCCGDRYLLLMADGSVQSDKGKCAIKERILAICAARDYWIATEQCVYQYSQQMEEICTFPHRIDELECDDTGRNVFARLADGRYVKLA